MINAQVRQQHRWLLTLCAAVIVVSNVIVTGIGLATAAPREPIPSQDLSAMVQQVSPAIVNVDAQLTYQQAQGAGTGIILDSDIVITNNHVIAGATKVQVSAIATGRTYDVIVLGYDRIHDVAVLQLQGAQGLQSAVIGDSDQVNLGDPVVSMGNVAGRGGMPVAVGGHIIGLNQAVSASDELTGGSESLTNMIEADTPIRSGDSGGPMVNTLGQVIGMNTAASDDGRSYSTGGNGYAIPINQAMNIANQIRSGQPSGTVHIGDTPFLGVGVNDAIDGVCIATLFDKTQDGDVTPAAEAGMQKGDVITAIDANPVRSATDLTSILDQHIPGDSIVISWRNPQGDEHTATVILVPGPIG